MDPQEALARNYRAALVGAVSRRSEANLHRGYELGRDALVDGVSVLDLARTHHECLVELLEGTAPDEVPAVAVAASEFFLEILATMDMAQRAYLEGRRAERATPAG
jgi:Phosphoserine phosphatase RsbU, N-terminal domain